MKYKAAYTRGVPNQVIEALESNEFALALLREISAGCLGAEKPEDRPAEYYVQDPDPTRCANGKWGVEMRLTGVSRSGRSPRVFHKALEQLNALVCTTVATALKEAGSDQMVQVFVVIMLDGDIETAPGSSVYSSNLESPAVWVDAKG